MRALDTRLLRRARSARLLLGADTAIGLATAVLVLLQATLLARVVARAFHGVSLADVSLDIAIDAGHAIDHERTMFTTSTPSGRTLIPGRQNRAQQTAARSRVGGAVRATATRSLVSATPTRPAAHTTATTTVRIRPNNGRKRTS